MKEKNKGPHKPSKGREFTAAEVARKRVSYMSIKEFKKAYSMDISVEGIAYHMKVNKIDYMQPSRDRFVLLTKVTLDFYGIEKL